MSKAAKRMAVADADASDGVDDDIRQMAAAHLSTSIRRPSCHGDPLGGRGERGWGLYFLT